MICWSVPFKLYYTPLLFLGGASGVPIKWLGPPPSSAFLAGATRASQLLKWLPHPLQSRHALDKISARSRLYSHPTQHVGERHSTASRQSQPRPFMFSMTSSSFSIRQGHARDRILFHVSHRLQTMPASQVDASSTPLA